ncbi:preprotein translocase subunit SecE [Candidatus Poribacteria bacterium]|nr:preprotein translocase subunit SecE [Candidatus Poribacteria bacterium]HDO76357.1 preprotein translocase subunit SecE [Candidatus Poribacteria bacterium]HEX29962.1 preprotein translocase subunit SecE [Candidatus Poribacteria bacterium]
MIERLKRYLKEVKLEWGKVSKPTYKDIWGSTVVVIVAVAIVAVYLWIVDFVLGRIIRLLFF